MLTSGDVVRVDLGIPTGSEAGFARPAVVVSAQRILDASPRVIHVVPLSTTLRRSASEVVVESSGPGGLPRPSVAQCQHLRAVSTTRVEGALGNVGPAVLIQIREMIGLILDLPT